MRGGLMPTSNEDRPTLADPPTGINWREVARSAIGSAFVAGLMGGALHVLGKMIEADSSANAYVADDMQAPPLDVEPNMAEVGESADDDAARAAALLGVTVDAREDDIRAALRARLASSQLHPDQGGDGEEAKQLIAAKNLLIERARATRS
jgi:hypothetical protein